MAEPERLICASEALVDGGAGVRFQVTRYGEVLPAFAVRFDGRVFGYINACAHVPVELDWQEGDFFDADGLYLVCATHGARYWPETGVCVAGPCTGARLRALELVERDGQVWLRDSAPGSVRQ